MSRSKKEKSPTDYRLITLTDTICDDDEKAEAWAEALLILVDEIARAGQAGKIASVVKRLVADSIMILGFCGVFIGRRPKKQNLQTRKLSETLSQCGCRVIGQHRLRVDAAFKESLSRRRDKWSEVTLVTLVSLLI